MSEPVVCKKCRATSYNTPGKTALYCQGCFSAAESRAEVAETQLQQVAAWLVNEIPDFGNDVGDGVHRLLKRLREEETDAARLREALGGYADSDLVSLAQTLNARNETLEAENQQLREALEAISVDMHQVSTWPCPTCKPISDLLDRPFGCYQYYAERK